MRIIQIIRTKKYFSFLGPKLWMEIQDGEGPTAPPVLGPVFLGQTLSLVFTLGDDVFNFDSNVLSCWATDGLFSHYFRV